MKLLIGMTQDGWFFNRSITSLLNWISWGLPTGLLERRSQGSNTHLGRKQERAKDIKHDCSSRTRNNWPCVPCVNSIMTVHKTKEPCHFPAAELRSYITNRTAQLLYRLANAFPLLLEVKSPKWSILQRSENLKEKSSMAKANTTLWSNFPSVKNKFSFRKKIGIPNKLISVKKREE